MPILTMATVNRVRMFANNCIVQNDENIIGRVIYHDKLKHVVYVIVRLNTFTWKIEKWDPSDCNEIQSYLWTINIPFACRYFSHHRSPDLRPIDMEID